MKLGTTDISAIKLGSTNISKAYLGSSVVYEESTTEYTGFYVEDVSGSDNTVNIKKNHNSAPTLTIEKSLDGKTWTSMGTTSTTEITATVPANGKLYLRCSTSAWCNINYYRNSIDCSSAFNVGGNIMSLLYGSDFTGEETAFRIATTFIFGYIFSNSSKLLSSENLLLPVMTLTEKCYQGLFYGCASLTTPPAIFPATTLATYCYAYAFTGCTSLKTAPELPAHTLVKGCYYSLFQGCTSLSYINVGFTDWPSTSSSASDYQATYQWTRLTVNTTGTFVLHYTLSRRFNKSGNNTVSSTDYTNAIPYGWTVESHS